MATKRGTSRGFLSKINLSLRSKLIAAFLAITLIPLFAVTVTVVLRIQSSLTDLAHTNLTDHAERITLDLSSSISRLSLDLQALASNPSVEQMAVLRATNQIRDLGLEGKTISEMEAIMEETRNLETNSRTQGFLIDTAADSGFEELIVVNLDGMVLGATGRPDRFVHIEEPWFQTALEHGSYISDIQPLPGREEMGIIFARVIYRASTVASTSARPAGLIRGLVPLSYFTDFIVSDLEKTERGQMQLFSEGQVLFCVRNTASGTLVDWESGSPNLNEIRLAEELGRSTGLCITGTDAITAYIDLDIEGSGLNWQVRLAQPTHAALALTSRLTAIGYAGIGFAALAAVVVTLILASNIARPIRGLTEHAKSAAEGQLRPYETKRRRRDETGDLTQAFNDMTAKLTRLLDSVRTASGELASSSQQISAGMEEMAAGTQNQIRDIQVGTDRMQEVNSAMSQIDKRAGAALRLSENANEAATRGQDLVQAAVGGMDSIKSSVDDLSGQTDEIGKILTFIQEIAEQTNLLALNAAIEAARAGEQGRSFAVVAQQVSELAARSQGATEEINEVLRRIRGETLRSVASVEDGQGQINAVQEALEKILQATRDTETLMQEIARASREQTGRTDQAVVLFESISQITEQTAAGAEETAASAQNLAELAQQLQDIITGFQS
ncbi:MAG: methyl-accepting chemotaxis protein [Firmicutes bacterium]|nr:methyl-accepting chemotaxis protein [Bacillota bacterium]